MKKHYKLLILFTFIVLCCFLFFFSIYPRINLKKTEIVEVFSEGEISQVTASAFFENVTDKVTVEGEVDYNKVGDYTLVYSLKYGIFNIKKKQTVKVVDRTAPVIQLNGDSDYSVCSIDRYQEVGYSAYDNYEGDISDHVTVDKTDNTIIYRVKDSSGNETTVKRNLIIEDKVAPEISFSNGNTVYLKQNDAYVERGAVAMDNCDGDISSHIVATNNININKIGTYEINYTVTDTAGNNSSAVRKVIVYDPNDTKTDDQPGVIYLTFDDGPSQHTLKILDILDKYEIKATFFVTGNGSDNAIREAYNRGNTIGLHTYTHNWNIYTSVDSYFADLNAILDRVVRITGNDNVFAIRFPGGSSNTVSRRYCSGIMTTLAYEVMNRGYQYYDWNVSVEDAGSCSKNNVADKQSCVLNNFKRQISKNKVNVVLLHDTKYYTADALENMIQYALENGYTFKAITNNSPTAHQNINN